MNQLLDFGEVLDDDSLVRFNLSNISVDTRRSPKYLTLGMPGVKTYKIQHFFKCGGYNISTWRCKDHSKPCGSCIPNDSEDFLVSHLPACRPLLNESDVEWWAENYFKRSIELQ